MTAVSEKLPHDHGVLCDNGVRSAPTVLIGERNGSLRVLKLCLYVELQ